MSEMIPFTDNYRDHSTDTGYQFEFVCERCGNGYTSSFQRSVMGFGSRLARGLGSVTGGVLGQIGYAGEEMRDTVRGPERDKALRKAVEEMRPNFVQCGRCGDWVCKEVCWNREAGLCANCAPKVEHEIGAIQSEARIQQMREKAQTIDYTKDINLRDAAVPTCPHCGVETQGGKFCPECGKPLSLRTAECSRCGTPLKEGARFCAECGQRVQG